MAEREGIRGPGAGWSRLWQTALHRSRAEWPVVLAAWLLLVSALTLLAAGTLYAQTVALGGLRGAILATPPVSRPASVRGTASSLDVERQDAAVAPVLSGALGLTGGEVALIARSDSFTPLSWRRLASRATSAPAGRSCTRSETWTWPSVHRRSSRSEVARAAAKRRC